MDITNLFNRFPLDLTEMGDFLQVLTESIRHARFLIKGRQDQENHDYAQNLPKIIIPMFSANSKLTTGSERVMSENFPSLVEHGLRSDKDVDTEIGKQLSHHFLTLLPTMTDSVSSLVFEVYSILLCCEQPNQDDSYSAVLTSGLLESLSPHFLSINMGFAQLGEYCTAPFCSFDENPIWLYEGTVQPESGVDRHKEKSFLRLLVKYARHEITNNKVLEALDRIGQTYGNVVRKKHSELDVEEYFKNFEVVKSIVAEFMEQGKTDCLENGAGLLTEQFNTNLATIGEKYPGNPFGFPKKYEMKMIIKYLKSGNEDDLDDRMLEDHCQMLRNIHHRILKIDPDSIGLEESVRNAFTLVISFLMKYKPKVLIHEEVD